MAALAVAVPLLGQLATVSSVKELAQRATAYSSIVLTLLTLVTVGATLAYVRLTRSMLLAMIEARRADVRPFLKLALGDLQVSLEEREEGTLLLLNITATMTNHGKGTAVGIKSEAIVPRAIDGDGLATEWLRTDVRWSPSNVLAPGDTIEGTASFFMPAYALPDRLSEFLELDTRYEDAHQGLYGLSHFFQLFNYGARTPKYALNPRYEALYYFPLEKRRSIRDREMSVSLAWGERPVYERRDYQDLTSA